MTKREKKLAKNEIKKMHRPKRAPEPLSKLTRKDEQKVRRSSNIGDTPEAVSDLVSAGSIAQWLRRISNRLRCVGRYRHAS